jgi:Fe-S oxidoreductase
MLPDPATATYFGLPGYVYLWALTVVACSVFAVKVLKYIRVLRSARAEKRWDHLPQRLRLFAVNVLGQRRLVNEPVIGTAHFVIFWAFVLYAASFGWNLVRGLVPSFPIPYADDIPPVAIALEVFAVLGLAALAVAAVRRYIFTPAHLERSGDATLILALITLVLVSSLGRQVLRARAPEFSLGFWWLHMVTVLGFLAYLPYSKHLHLLASPFGVFFGSLEPRGMPAPSEGAALRQEFTWRQLFSGLACAECGRCDRACPSVGSGYPLSPKELMSRVKELVRAPDGHVKPVSLVGDMVKPEEIWACTTCYACMQQCPVFNEHIPVLMEMRRHLVSQGQVEDRLQETLTRLTRYGNSFGASPRARAKWTQGLDFKIKDARKEPVEYLWFVGDYASYDPRLAPATQAMARVLHRVGVDFGILYEGEQNAGNDLRRVGEEGLFEMLVEKNQKALAGAHFQQIVTTDPHTYHVLKNEYPAMGGDGHVLHYTELLAQLFRAGKLPLRHSLELRLTYHDPCYLGRYNGVYEAPRRILSELGATLVEMPRNRGDSYCCGAGGGRIWMEDAPGIKERPAENRVREAAGLRGVETLVVSCPKDLVMFQDAIKTTGLEGKLIVRDLSELVEQATGSAERSETSVAA